VLDNGEYGFDKSKQAGNGTSTSSNVSGISLSGSNSKIEDVNF
jgi:hypothetical protein